MFHFRNLSFFMTAETNQTVNYMCLILFWGWIMPVICQYFACSPDEFGCGVLNYLFSPAKMRYICQKRLLRGTCGPNVVTQIIFGEFLASEKNSLHQFSCWCCCICLNSITSAVFPDKHTSTVDQMHSFPPLMHNVITFYIRVMLHGNQT